MMGWGLHYIPHDLSFYLFLAGECCSGTNTSSRRFTRSSRWYRNSPPVNRIPRRQSGHNTTRNSWHSFYAPYPLWRLHLDDGQQIRQRKRNQQCQDDPHKCHYRSSDSNSGLCTNLLYCYANNQCYIVGPKPTSHTIWTSI